MSVSWVILLREDRREMSSGGERGEEIKGEREREREKGSRLGPAADTLDPALALHRQHNIKQSKTKINTPKTRMIKVFTCYGKGCLSFCPFG